MHFEIIDCYFNIFFVQIQQKKENMKSVFGPQSQASKLVYQSHKQPEYVTEYKCKINKKVYIHGGGLKAL